MNNETTHMVDMNEPKLLFKGSYSTFNPELAEKLSLNEAIVLQKIQSNIEENPIQIDGLDWVHKTYEEWQVEDFPYWSKKTVERIFRKLVDKELIKLKKEHSLIHGPINYYRINYDNLERHFQDNE